MAFCVPSAYVPSGNENYIVPYADPYTSGEFVNPSPLVLPVGPIANVNVSNVTTTGFTVTLDAVLYATNYHFQWGTYSGNNTLPSFSFTGLPPNTTNNLQITAYNEDGSIFSTPQSVSTLLPPPIAPYGLVADNIAPTSFELGWEVSPYASSYTATWGAYVGDVSGTTAQFTGLPPSTNNYCLVTASNASGNALSAPYPVVTGLPAPTAPTNVDAFGIVPNSFQCSWTPVPYASSYTATWSTPTVYNGVVSGSNATFSNLPNNTLGDLVVTASNYSGTASSTPLPVHTNGLPPDAPTGLTTTRTGGTYFWAEWTNDPKVDSYTATVNGNPCDVSGNTCVASGLAYGSSNTLIVNATNSFGTTPSSPLAVNTTNQKFFYGVNPTTPLIVYPDSGFSAQNLGSFTIPSDFDNYANSDIYTKPQTIFFDKWFEYVPYPVAGAFMAFRASKKADVNFFDQEFVAFLPETGTGNEWGNAERPNAPSWNGTGNWTFQADDTITLFFLIPYPAWDVLVGEVNELSFNYDTFTVP